VPIDISRFNQLLSPAMQEPYVRAHTLDDLAVEL
jgi:hypothetical protein